MLNAQIDPIPSLADLVASRLCHDLVNPLGAISNGVELLGLAGKMDSPEMALISDAIKAAEARIRFLRLAFGAAGADQTTSNREARQAVEGYFQQGRISVEWDSQGDRLRQDVKLICLMLLCTETALPMGGKIALNHTPNGAIRLVAQGTRLSVAEDLWGILRFDNPKGGPPIRPADAHFPILLRTAEDRGINLNYVTDGNALHLSTG